MRTCKRFSTMRRIKCVLRNIMCQEGLTALDMVLTLFVASKDRRVYVQTRIFLALLRHPIDYGLQLV